MSALVLHFASGAAFFSGSLCLLAGLLAVTFGRRQLVCAAGRLLLLLSIYPILASATPLPIWAWVLWGAALAFWLASVHPRLATRPRLRCSNCRCRPFTTGSARSSGASRDVTASC